MKKLVLVITLLVTFGVQAQERKERMKDTTPEERVEKRTARLSEKLGLDENQKSKVKEIMITQQKENQKVREEIKAEKEKLRAKIEENLKKQQEELKEKLKTVLTEEQFKKWEELQKNNQEKIKNHKRKDKKSQKKR